ncbi:MAG: hypothetical protein JXR40_14045 [Pontiellaceae bacterium]|nr:hypothetical protein [Pontiellaceae bacterium]
MLLAVLVVLSAAHYAAADFTIAIDDPSEANPLNPLGTLTDPTLSEPTDPFAELTIDNDLSTSGSDDPFNLSARPVEVTSDKKDPGEEVWNRVHDSLVKTNSNNGAALNDGNALKTYQIKNVITDLEDEDDTNTSFFMSKPAIMGIIIGVGIALLGLRRVLRI